MRILYFTQLFYPFLFGGGEYIFYLFARELARRGHIVDVVTQQLISTTNFEVYENVNIHRIGKESTYKGTLPPTITQNFDFFINAIRKGRQIINEGKKKG